MWFAAHLIISLRKIDQLEKNITVYENVFLIEASSTDDARIKANEIGLNELHGYDGITIDEVPTQVEFSGIRKIISISNEPPLNQDRDSPVSGSEITYSCFEIEDQAGLNKLVSGEEVSVLYQE